MCSDVLVEKTRRAAALKTDCSLQPMKQGARDASQHRAADASCLSVVSFNITVPRAQSFIISYFGFLFTNAYS